MSILRDIIPKTAESLRPKEPQSLLNWVGPAGFTIDGNAFDISQAPWMKPIYEDDSRTIVCRKGSQVGFSSFSLARVLWSADQLGRRWIYFLPTDTETDDFVADRVEGTINGSEYLKSRIGNTDNRGLKNLGPGTIYFRGLHTKRHAKSVPADGLVFDEVDEHSPENVAFAEDRNLQSLDPVKLYLSVPSMTRYGIDRMFADSDQHFWHSKCPACGEWNCVDTDFPANFLPVALSQRKSFPDGATHYRGCRWCSAELDTSQGDWVAKEPGSRTRGYHLSRLINNRCPPNFPNAATYIMWEWQQAQGDSQRTGRFVIAFRGYPFDGEGARITAELLLSLEAGHGFYYSGHGCVMGVDQGNRIHVGIYQVLPGARLHLIYCEVTERWSRVSDLFRRYGCYLGVCDRGPNIHSARQFASEFPGRVYLQSFGNDQIEANDNGRIKRRVAQDLHDGRIPIPWVTVDRTTTLDATVDLVDGSRLILPDRARLSGDDRRNYDEYCLNLENLKWKFEDTPSGRRKVYLRNENHHGMELNSARIGAFELGLSAPAPNVMPVFMRMGNA